MMSRRGADPCRCYSTNTRLRAAGITGDVESLEWRQMEPRNHTCTFVRVFCAEEGPRLRRGARRGRNCLCMLLVFGRIKKIRRAITSSHRPSRIKLRESSNAPALLQYRPSPLSSARNACNHRPSAPASRGGDDNPARGHAAGRTIHRYRSISRSIERFVSRQSLRVQCYQRHRQADGRSGWRGRYASKRGEEGLYHDPVHVVSVVTTRDGIALIQQ